MSDQRARIKDPPFRECHIRDIEKLGADLNEAVQAAWPKRHSIRYSQVFVLLLSWEADDLNVNQEIEPLRAVLVDRYHFSAQHYKIPSVKPDKALKKRVYEFLEVDDNDTLLIVYYAGHARSAFQSNEASLWFANRNDPNLVVPSGGIQSMLEEADADIILLCDCCHSTAIPTTDSQQRKSNKVMEAITACGYETVAAEVGDHSFTNALTHVLAIASKGLPFTISELHARVVSKLKCWTPELRKGEDGNYIDAAANRLLFEQQHRRTPIFTVVCRASPTRSIIIAPLSTIYPSPPDSGDDRTSQSSGNMPGILMDIDNGEEVPSHGEAECKKRKRQDDDEGRYPFVLLAARLEKRYQKQDWLEWIRNAPTDVKYVHVEGAYASFSTLLLLRLPATIWNLLPKSSAYIFIGYVTSGNYALTAPDGPSVPCPCGDVCANCFTEASRPSGAPPSTNAPQGAQVHYGGKDPSSKFLGRLSTAADQGLSGDKRAETIGQGISAPSSSQMPKASKLTRSTKSSEITLPTTISATKAKASAPSDEKSEPCSSGSGQSSTTPKMAAISLSTPSGSYPITRVAGIESRRRVGGGGGCGGRFERRRKVGWWVCCQDRREVNSETWGGNCPDCSHVKCSDCDYL